MQLIKEEMNNILNELVGEGFKINRFLDRTISVMDVKFAMNKTVSQVHPRLAHAYPVAISDAVSEYQSSRNMLTVYPETPIANEDYSSPNEIFEKFLAMQLSLEENVSEALVYAKESGDMSTYSFLIEFLRKVNVFTNQAILLRDKINAYGNNSFAWMMFDENIESFMIV